MDRFYAAYVQPHPALYWLGFLSSGWLRLAVWTFIFFGSFYLWDRNQHSRSRNVNDRDWIGEWAESERQFRKWENSDVFAEWFEGQWSIRSDRDPVARQEVYAACQLAGSRLLRSPGMKLSKIVASQVEHGERWLYFLKETEGLNRKLDSSDSGYIQSLARISALACTKCAAKAFDS
jgi:hypothetical protein